MSIQELSTQIAEVRQMVMMRDKASRDRKRVSESLLEEYKRRYGLVDALKKESHDVEHLEGTSLSGLVYAFLGSKDAHLDKERQEKLSAQLKLDQCNYVISEMEKDLSRLESFLSTLQGLDERIESLMKKKEELLLQSNNADTHTLMALAEETGTLQATQEELFDTIDAGKSIRTSMNCVIEDLNSALHTTGSPLGVWREHSRIEEARFHIRLAQATAKRFARELAEIDPKMDAAIRLGPGFKASEYFFDNPIFRIPIMELFLGFRVSEALDIARSTRTQVDHCLDDLNSRLTENKHKIADIAEQRRRLIELA